MATITYTRAKVYSDTTGTTQVGQTIEVTGSPSTITMDSSTLGVKLNPGSQYSVSVQCTNDEGYTTAWTSPYPYKTLILASWQSFTGGKGAVSPSILCTYTAGVLSVNEVGVYLSTNASGANAVKYSADDEETAEKGWVIKGLTENTTYYAVPYVVDDLGREYTGDWSEAKQANTGYAVPVVTISDVATTYKSISGNVLVTTNDTLQSVRLSIIPTGGGGNYQYKTLTATTGTQSWSIANGDLDDTGKAITVNPSTEYKIAVEAVDVNGGSTTAQVTATTAAQTTVTIAITGVTKVTPTSAVVNLSYGAGGSTDADDGDGSGS